VNDDVTIAAISTARAPGAISIVRISGSSAFDITRRIFKAKVNFKDMPSHTVAYGFVIDNKNHEVIDQVLVLKMVSPNTFTGEDIVEINCHGGLVVTSKVLELVLQNGACIAEPGEFTKRAFLNGKIDLSQAEAVIDIINAKTMRSSRAAMEQLQGGLSRRVSAIRDRLINLLAHIEASLEYPEYDIENITSEKIYNEITHVRAILVSMIKGFERGRIIKEGVKVAIVGKPNVGKSSLLNYLSGKDRAIVTDIPGTTRDIVEEYISIDGIPVRLIDTAGIRKTSDVIEKIGVGKTLEVIDIADMIIVMLDITMSDHDLDILKKIENKKNVIVINKIDLAKPRELEEIKRKLFPFNIISMSVATGEGIEQLEQYIVQAFLGEKISNSSHDVIITNTRHKSLLDNALTHIDNVIEGYHQHIPIDLITIDIRGAAGCLGQITGECVEEDVLNKIFERFCVGK